MKTKLYFKIEKESPTGKKIMDIMQRCDKFFEEAKRLKKKYGFDEIYCVESWLCGCTGVSFKNQPPERWKLLKNEFDEHSSPKRYWPYVANKVAYRELRKLASMRVRRSEIDALLNQTDIFHNVGHNVKHPNYIGIVTTPGHNVSGDDVTPISENEYKQLFG